MKKSYVYIISNKNRTTFYIGITSDLKKRIEDHEVGMGSVFAAKYKLKDLIYYEKYIDINQAINREKQLKNWHREWKLNLIKQTNPKLEKLIF